MEEKEVHAFIIWSKGLQLKDKILGDIRTKFDVLRITNTTWSSNKFSENLSRFYGENLPKNSSKEKHCGKGTFLCIIVRDNNPKYEFRETSKGIKPVNIKMFDAKQLYRDWTGGGHKIHGSDNVAEAKSNVYLLFGIKYNSLINLPETNEISSYNKDLIGANGWNSLADLFDTFNELSNYVVLRNFVDIEQELNNLHPDIDLLTDNRRLLVDISNGKPTFEDKKRVQHLVMIKDQKVYFDFRYLGDNYYDYRWGQRILSTRIKFENIYVPNNENHFYSLMYHAYIHKPRISLDYINKLINFSHTVGLNYNEKSFLELKILNDLNAYMLKKNYHYVEPRDLTVYFNNKIIERFIDIQLSKARNTNEAIRLFKRRVKGLLRKFGLKIGS